MKYYQSQARDKEKSESLTGFEPITSQTPGGNSIHLSYGELMESKAIYWVHIRHASCTLLGSAMSMS